jgi:hypothetical protein
MIFQFKAVNSIAMIGPNRPGLKIAKGTYWVSSRWNKQWSQATDRKTVKEKIEQRNIGGG